MDTNTNTPSSQSVALDEQILTPQQIRQMGPEAFKKHLAKLEERFSEINRSLTPIAKEIASMKAHCPHHNSEPRPHARFCTDCGEYYKIDTSFSPGI